MNDSTSTSFRNRCSQYWNFLQGELLPNKAAGLADTVQRELKKQKFEPTADQCNALAVAASPAIKRASALNANAGMGIFPKT